MAIDSLDDSILTLNPSLNKYDQLSESIIKADALVHVLLAINDLEEISHTVLHDFLWALSDYTHQTVTLYDSIFPE